MRDHADKPRRVGHRHASAEEPATTHTDRRTELTNASATVVRPQASHIDQRSSNFLAPLKPAKALKGFHLMTENTSVERREQAANLTDRQGTGQRVLLAEPKGIR